MLAIGIALVYSVMGFLNIAHGDLLTLCGYGMFFAIGMGLPWPLVIGLGILVAGVSPVALSAFLSGSYNIGGIVVGMGQTIAIIVTILALTALTMFLRRTTLGLAMQAAAQDFDTTRLMGINANRVIAAAFFIAGILAGIAGVLIIAQRGSADPLMSLSPLIKALIAAIVGGTGSLYGPVLGGIILGVLETVFQTILPGNALFFRDPLVLSLLVAFLLFAPNGIIGLRVERVR